jgi:hypothetical protein
MAPIPLKDLNAAGDRGRAAWNGGASVLSRAYATIASLPMVDSRSLRAPPQPVSEPDLRRAKIWQLGASLHCSIIGTCLTTSELRTLVRKFKAATAENPSDHDLHGIAVSAAGRRDPLAKQIQKALDRRHGAAINRCDKANSADELQRHWDEARRNGDIPGMYWAILTHPRATEALVRRVFGDVHMLSHLVGAANRADIRRLHQLEEEKAALEETLARQQVRLRDSVVTRDAKIRDLNASLATRIESEAALASSGRGTSSDTALLNGLIVDLGKRLDAEVRRRERAERRAGELAAARGEADRDRVMMERERAALRGELEIAEAGLAAFLQTGSERGVELDLAGVTILYVGGRPHHVARLRLLIEHVGGQFIHHDGGIEERMNLLPGLVSRAVAAVFPVDCISHDAALSLKRLCRQAGKPFIPLRSTGFGSLLHAIRSLGVTAAVTCGA